MLITAAVIFSTLRAVLPYATGYKNEIQQEISKQLGLPVEIKSIDAAIHWFSPRLKLIDVSVYDDKDKVPLFHFEEAFLGLDVVASVLRREVIIDDVGLIGADLSIEKLSETEWMVQGIRFTGDGSSELPDQFIYMIQNSDYLLHDSNIYYKDHTGEKLELSLLDVNINVENNFYNHDITFSMNLPDEYGESLAVVADLQGDFDNFDGELYVEATRLKVRQWNKKFKLFDSYQADAVLDVDLWVTVDDNVIHEIFASISADDLALKNNQTARRWKTRYISGDVRYVHEDDFSSLTLSRFSFGEAVAPAWGREANLIAYEDDTDYSLSADFLRVADLQSIAEVFLNSDQLKSLEKLDAYQPGADIYNLDLKLPKDKHSLIKPITIAMEAMGIDEDGPVEHAGEDARTVDDIVDAKSDTVQVAGKKQSRSRAAKKAVSDAPDTGAPAVDDPAMKDNATVDGSVAAAESSSETRAIKPYKQRLMEEMTFSATFHEVSVRDKERGINLSGLDLVTQVADGQLQIEFASEDSSVELSKLFRYPLVARIIQGTVTLQPQLAATVDNGEGIQDADSQSAANGAAAFSLSQVHWKIASDQLQVRTDHINTFSRLNAEVTPHDGVFVDMQSNYYDGRGEYASRYLPVGIMNPKLVDWLDMAVIDGYIPQGSFVLHGKLSDFPYRDDSGVFQVLFKPRDVALRFLSDWPQLNRTSATVEFFNESLFVHDASSTTRAAKLTDGYAEILDLKNPHISISFGALAKNEDVQDYIWNSPLDNTLGGPLRLFQFDGRSDLELTLEVPLVKGEELAIEGQLKLIDTDIYYPVLGYELASVNGVFDFTRDSVFADSVAATMNGRPVVINAFTQNGENGKRTVYHLDGPIAADYLLQRYDWMPASWIDGESDWSIDVDVPYQADDYLVHIRAASNLEGVVINTSDTVHKPVARTIGFIADIDVLEHQGMHIEATATLDDAVSGSDSEAARAPADPSKVVKLFATRSGNEIWNFNIRSALVRGDGEFAEGLDKTTAVKLDMDYVDLAALFSQQGSGSSRRLSPEMFPPLYWNAKKLVWKDWTFFDVALETAAHQHGMVINKLSLTGPAMTFDARGTWLTTWRGTHESLFEGDISSTQCGDSLEGLGFQRSIDRCSYHAKFESKWPAEPYALSWENMTGNTSFTLKDGEILEVDPGAGGRLLGLLNIFKLANRLSLDFDDVTREGFAFDFIEGDFEFVRGDGSLKNFNISASAADINMFGSINLLKRDYGLLMRVKPHTDTLTFAGGTLLGGVVVGAGLALIQKIFDLGIIGHNVYSITGSWDDPQVEKIVEQEPVSPIGGDDEDDF